MGGCRAAKVKDFFRSQKIVFCSMHHFSSFFGCYFRFFVYEHALISYFFSLFSSFSQGTKLGKAELFSFSWWYWQCLLQTCSCVRIRKTKKIIIRIKTKNSQTIIFLMWKRLGLFFIFEISSFTNQA